MSKPRRVSGRVRFEGAAPHPGRLNLVVQLRTPWVEWAFDLGRLPAGVVDDSLNFELRDLYPRPLLVALRGLPEGWVVKAVRHGGREITDIPTDFGAAPPDRSLEIVATNRVAFASVRVTDEEGRPVTAYAVLLAPADRTRWKAGPVLLDGTPSRDGVLDLGPRLPGDYLIAAVPLEDYREVIRDSARFDSLERIARAVTFIEGNHPTVELRLTHLPQRQ